MNKILPQQRLLLELLVMSGEVAVPDDADGTILSRTVRECLERKWILRDPVGGGFCKLSVTALGRAALS